MIGNESANSSMGCCAPNYDGQSLARRTHHVKAPIHIFIPFYKLTGRDRYRLILSSSWEIADGDRAILFFHFNNAQSDCINSTVFIGVLVVGDICLNDTDVSGCAGSWIRIGRDAKRLQDERIPLIGEGDWLAGC